MEYFSEAEIAAMDSLLSDEQDGDSFRFIAD